MMLKFFQFRNIEKAENPELVKEYFKRNFYKWKVKCLEEELEAYREEARPVFKTWSKEQYKEWYENEENHYGIGRGYDGYGNAVLRPVKARK